VILRHSREYGQQIVKQLNAVIYGDFWHFFSEIRGAFSKSFSMFFSALHMNHRSAPSLLTFGKRFCLLVITVVLF